MYEYVFLGLRISCSRLRSLRESVLVKPAAVFARRYSVIAAKQPGKVCCVSIAGHVPDCLNRKIGLSEQLTSLLKT